MFRPRGHVRRSLLSGVIVTNASGGKVADDAERPHEDAEDQDHRTPVDAM